MTLHASFIWKNPDATKDLNDRIRRIVNRGIVWGGALNPAGAGLQVIVDPVVAVSFDGMTVSEDAQETLTVAAGERNYVVLWAKYNEGGVPATPTLTYQVYKEADYLIHPEKDYLIVYGVVELAPAAIGVTLSDIDLTVRDEIDPLGRDWYRGRVATSAGLPVGPPTANRIGDFYFVDADNTFYFWNSTIWEPLNTGSYNTETVVMSQMVAQTERARIVDGSGFVGGPRPGPGADASEIEAGIVETPSVADQVGVDTAAWKVNGHFVETHGQYVTLAAKPGGGFRYDIIFLEVWREAVTVPELFTYDRNPDGASQYTLEEVDDKLQQLEWSAGIPVAPTADNFNVNALDARSHAWRVVKFRLGTASNMPSSVALYNPSDPTISAACTNHDGNPFASEPAGSGMDDRIWRGTSTISSDGYSWAIPLFVLRRVSTENAGAANAVKVFRDGVRHVFPVYPNCDVDKTARSLAQNVHSSEPAPFGLAHFPHKKPSGFMGGFAQPLRTAVGVDNVQVASKPFKFRVRGVEDAIAPPGGLTAVDIGTPPVAVGTWARTLIYLKMNVTMYNNEPGASVANYYQSTLHRPLIPSSPTGTIRAQGWKRGYISYQFVAEDLGANDYRDEYDAMVASGWTRGDVTLTTAALQFEDGGLWSRSIPIDDDDRVHPFETEWAVPVCVVHRRNTQPWVFGTNPNGSGGRTDGRDNANVISPDDLADLRHRVGVTEAQYKPILEESVDKALKGQLRTRMANKYTGAGISGVVAGSRILQTDYIGASGGGAFELALPDGNRRTWSDAKEFALVSMELDMSVGASSDDLHDWAVAGMIGTLTIKAPPGSHLVRHIPGCLYAEGDNADPDFLDFLGPPCWSTRYDPSFLLPSHASAKVVDGSNQLTNLPFWRHDTPGSNAVPDYGQPFKVVPGTLDDQGRATEMTGYVNLNISTDTAVLSWWVHYDRTFTGPYSANYGLAEIPDTVHKVTFDPTGTAEDVHVGPIYTTIRKTVAASLTVTITDADVTAATGTPGTVRLLGIDPQTVRSDPDMATFLTVTSYSLTHTTLDAITVTFSAPYTGDLVFDVFYDSDIARWIEVGRGGKSVQALFSWGVNDTIDLGATPPAVSEYSFGIGSATWGPIATDRDMSNFAAPLIFTRASLIVDWTQLPGGLFVPFPHSNLITLDTLITNLPMERYVMIVWPNQTPLALAEKLQIDYTYTPYQGLSSSGGAAPVPATAVPELRSLLHGTVEENTDFFATQTGPSSYFSGVNAFSGFPVSNTADGQSVTGLSMGDDRMSTYNRTALVAPEAPYGAQPSATLASQEQARLNAACVLRLPYPMDPAMVSSTVTNYHSSVMEFDLDPLRAGAAAGVHQCAPGYPNTSYTNSGSTAQNLSHQYVNGLTRLRVSGGVHEEDKSYIASADRYAISTTVFPPLSNLNQGYRVQSASAGDLLDYRVGFDGPLNARILRTMTLMETDANSGSGETTGMFFYNPVTRDWAPNATVNDLARYTVDTRSPGVYRTYWTAVNIWVGGVTSEKMFVTYPAIVQEYARQFPLIFGARWLQPVLKLFNNPGGAVTGYIYETEFTASTEAAFELSGLPFPGGRKKVTDLIKVPFGSYESNETSSTLGSNYGSSAASVSALKGLTVEYPANWSDPTKLALEGLIQGGDNGRGGGRGLYLGSTESRYCMPMFVPGTGTTLQWVLRQEHLVVDQEDAPPTFPYMPADALFNQSTQTYIQYDIGGPLAYVFFGALMRPTDFKYKNRMVMQISGGPTGGIDTKDNNTHYSPEDLDGTAIDAFWPIGRPLFDPVD